MQQPSEPRTAQAGSLLSQWWTLGTILTDRRTVGRHASVAWVIIDRYMQRKGNGRASARYIAQATGLGLRHVVRACQELTEWGYFELHVGTGTRPTEYTPKWSSVSPMGNTKRVSASVSPMGNTSVSPVGNTTASSVSPMGNESYLPEPADKAGLRVSGNDDTLDPLPTAGLAAAEAGSRDPGSAFDRYWSAYPRKHQRSRAETAWTKIAPDAVMAEEIIAGAQRLADHYAEHPVDKKWMKQPANWLAGKGWTEDLPEVYVDAKQAAIAKKASAPKPSLSSDDSESVADNDNEPEPDEVPWFLVGSPKLWPVGRFVGKFVDGEVVKEGPDKIVTMDFEIQEGEHAGKILQHRFYVEAYMRSAQEEGQAILSRMCHAVGLASITNTDELQFKQLVAIADGQTVTYEASVQEAA